MTRILDLPEGVSQTDPWPYAEMPATMPSEGAWTLLMDASGNVAVWPTDGEPPESLGMLPFWSHDDKVLLCQWLATFCEGCGDDPGRYPHQDGRRYVFNWVCGTLAQLSIASQVAHAFFDPAEPDPQKRAHSAWAIGKEFDRKINAADLASLFQARMKGLAIAAESYALTGERPGVTAELARDVTRLWKEMQQRNVTLHY